MKTSSQGLGAQSKLFCRLHELRGDLWLWVSSSSSLPPSLSISTSQRFNYFLFTPMKLCPIVSQVRLQTTAKSGDPVLGQPRHSGRRTWAAWGTCWGEARGEFSSTLRELYCLNLYSASMLKIWSLTHFEPERELSLLGIILMLLLFYGISS